MSTAFFLYCTTDGTRSQDLFRFQLGAKLRRTTGDVLYFHFSVSIFVTFVCDFLFIQLFQLGLSDKSFRLKDKTDK